MKPSLLLTLLLTSASTALADPAPPAKPAKPAPKAPAKAPTKPGISTAKVVDLRVESQTNPTAVNTPLPRFSWRIETEERGWLQKSYHILVASTPGLLAQGKGDLWDSGEVTSGRSSFIRFGGTPLASKQMAHWKVKLTSQRNQNTSWSDNGLLTIGLTGPTPLPTPLFLPDAPRISHFECSDPTLNELFISGNNSISELTGLRDISLSIRSAGYHTQLLPRSKDWIRALHASSDDAGFFPASLPSDGTYGSTQSDAGILVPYSIWWMTGDVAIIKKSWPCMYAYTIARTEVDPTAQGLPFGLLPQDTFPLNDATPQQFAHLACEALNVRLMLEMGQALGHQNVSELRKLTEIRTAIHKQFKKDHLTKKDEIRHASLTANVMALRYGLLTTKIEKNLAMDKILSICAIAPPSGLDQSPAVAYGLLPTLTWTGNHRTAIELAQAQDPAALSRVALTSISEWLISMVAGIGSLEAGFQRIHIQPHIMNKGGLSYVNAFFDSPHGRVSCNWKKTDSGYSIEILVPPNTTALVRLPTSDNQSVYENNIPIDKIEHVFAYKRLTSETSFVVASGRHLFQVR